jgi:uncharacterized protein with HEPN domain
MCADTRRDEEYLSDIREAIERIVTYVKGITYKGFLEDHKTQDAVIRNLQVIGEAAKKVSPATRRRLNGVPWREMSGIRDKVVHDYFGISIDIVWQVATRDLPDILGKLFPNSV